MNLKKFVVVVVNVHAQSRQAAYSNSNSSTEAHHIIRGTVLNQTLAQIQTDRQRDRQTEAHRVLAHIRELVGLRPVGGRCSVNGRWSVSVLSVGCAIENVR